MVKRMSVLSVNNWQSLESHLQNWEIEMVYPDWRLIPSISPDLLKRHKTHCNTILEELAFSLKGGSVKHKDAYFQGFFAFNPDPWRILLPLLFTLECERCDVGRLMIAELKFQPFGKQNEPLYSMTKGHYPTACVICHDPFIIDCDNWATERKRVRCERRSCRYEWDKLMKPVFKRALDAALTIRALLFSIRRENKEVDIKLLEKLTSEYYKDIQEAYAYLNRFLYKREKTVKDAEEPIKRGCFIPRYRKSPKYKTLQKEFWPNHDLTQDPSAVLYPALKLNSDAFKTPSALDKAVQTRLKSLNRSNK